MPKMTRAFYEENQAMLKKMKHELQSAWNQMLLDHMGCELEANHLNDEYKARLVEQMKFNEMKHRNNAQALLATMDYLSAELKKLAEEA